MTAMAKSPRDQACLAACPDQDGDGYSAASCNSDRQLVVTAMAKIRV